MAVSLQSSCHALHPPFWVGGENYSVSMATNLETGECCKPQPWLRGQPSSACLEEGAGCKSAANAGTDRAVLTCIVLAELARNCGQYLQRHSEIQGLKHSANRGLAAPDVRQLHWAQRASSDMPLSSELLVQ
jgi:hypothetical protein